MHIYHLNTDLIAMTFLAAGMRMEDRTNKVFTMRKALQDVCGHNLPMFHACCRILNKGIAPHMNPSQWLKANGVSYEHLLGLGGMRNVHSWCILWFKHLHLEYKNSDKRTIEFKFDIKL